MNDKETKHDHKFVEMNAGKTEGNMRFKDLMCSEDSCHHRQRMHEDGRVEKLEE